MININSPLNQFEVINLFGISSPILDHLNIIITNIALYLLIIIIIVIGSHFTGFNDSNIIPNKFSITFETVYASIFNMVKTQIGYFFNLKPSLIHMKPLIKTWATTIIWLPLYIVLLGAIYQLNGAIIDIFDLSSSSTFLELDGMKDLVTILESGSCFSRPRRVNNQSDNTSVIEFDSIVESRSSNGRSSNGGAAGTRPSSNVDNFNLPRSNSTYSFENDRQIKTDSDKGSLAATAPKSESSSLTGSTSSLSSSFYREVNTENAGEGSGSGSPIIFRIRTASESSLSSNSSQRSISTTNATIGSNHSHSISKKATTANTNSGSNSEKVVTSSKAPTNVSSSSSNEVRANEGRIAPCNTPNVRSSRSSFSSNDGRAGRIAPCNTPVETTNSTESVQDRIIESVIATIKNMLNQ